MLKLSLMVYPKNNRLILPKELYDTPLSLGSLLPIRLHSTLTIVTLL